MKFAVAALTVAVVSVLLVLPVAQADASHTLTNLVNELESDVTTFANPLEPQPSSAFEEEEEEEEELEVCRYCNTHNQAPTWDGSCHMIKPKNSFCVNGYTTGLCGAKGLKPCTKTRLPFALASHLFPIVHREGKKATKTFLGSYNSNKKDKTSVEDSSNYCIGFINHTPYGTETKALPKIEIIQESISKSQKPPKDVQVFLNAEVTNPFFTDFYFFSEFASSAPRASNSAVRTEALIAAIEGGDSFAWPELCGMVKNDELNMSPDEKTRCADGVNSYNPQLLQNIKDTADPGRDALQVTFEAYQKTFPRTRRYKNTIGNWHNLFATWTKIGPVRRGCQ